MTLALIALLLSVSPASAAQESSAAASQLTETTLHNGIIHAFDTANYKETVRLLALLKKSYPDSYNEFPYALLLASTLNLQGSPAEAFNAYQQVYNDKRWIRFSLLPLARISALQEKTDQAISYYKEYLKGQNNPDYREIALEALDYCVIKGKSADLAELATIIEQKSGLQRTAEYYRARSFRMEQKDEAAKTLLLSLIRKRTRDDITSLSLSELDSIDGKSLTESERAERGELAVDVWNFRLARRYLEPISTQTPEYGYYYARSLYFLGDVEGSKKAFQSVITLWPKDPIAKRTRSQYAFVCLRSGDYEKALELLRQLPRDEGNAFHQVQALRALGRLKEAITLLNPYVSSRNRKASSSARFLRGRVLFQLGRYSDALADFSVASSPRSTVDLREALMWKALALEKMGRHNDANDIYRRLSGSSDYFALKAAEKLGAGSVPKQSYTIQYNLCRLPDFSAKEEVKKRIDEGDLLPGLLYVHLYEDAADLLPDVSSETWTLLSVNGSDRLQRFLGITQLAALGEDYAKATYYSELFLKALPKSIKPASLPREILQVLFPLPYINQITKFSKARGVDPLLVTSIMKQESKFKRLARSGAFARGLMQLIPETAGKIAVALGLANFTQEQLYLPDVSINLGTKYLQDMTEEFGNEVEILAAGYNGGEANLRRWLATSPSRNLLDFFSNIDMSETKNYVMIVKTNYELYKKIYGTLPEPN